MTIEEAIRIMALEREDWETSHCTPYERKCAFDMAIEALTAQPETHEERTETHGVCLDAISRQAAIDALKEHRALFCDNTPDTFSKLSYAEKSRVDELDMAIATLINLPSAQPETHWIPCSERLPEKSGRYLVTRGLKACNAIWNRVYIINYTDLMGLKAEKIWWDGNVGKSDFQKIDDVIAWMPLPEPYREGES